MSNERRADGQRAPRLACGCLPRRGWPTGRPDDPRHRGHAEWHRANDKPGAMS